MSSNENPTLTIDDKHVAQFHYILKDDQGKELENSYEHDPIAYLHGVQNMLPGLTKALTGRKAGEKFEVTLAPAESYGEVQPNAEQRVPVKHLMGSKKWKKGMTALVETDKGRRQVTIVKMGKFMATVDMNHPWAGKTLTFELEILNVRPATAEELDHGHAHGVGGHQH